MTLSESLPILNPLGALFMELFITVFLPILFFFFSPWFPSKICLFALFSCYV